MTPRDQQIINANPGATPQQLAAKGISAEAYIEIISAPRPKTHSTWKGNGFKATAEHHPGNTPIQQLKANKPGLVYVQNGTTSVRMTREAAERLVKKDPQKYRIL